MTMVETKAIPLAICKVRFISVLFNLKVPHFFEKFYQKNKLQIKVTDLAQVFERIKQVFTIQKQKALVE
jgi:hypothetical protein